MHSTIYINTKHTHTYIYIYIKTYMQKCIHMYTAKRALHGVPALDPQNTKNLPLLTTKLR